MSTIHTTTHTTMYTTIYTTKYRQQGVAGIIFIVMLPFLAGFMCFVLESGRYLRAKAALGDAAEAAVLMTTALDDSANVEKEALIKYWLTAQVKEGHHFDANLDRISCNNNPVCHVYKDTNTYTEYRLKVDSEYAQWFGNENISLFPEKQPLGHRVVARKFMGDGSVDVYFVADFSFSMMGTWEGEIRIDMLKNMIMKVADSLEHSTAGRPEGSGKNTIAFIPFSSVTTDMLDGMKMCVRKGVLECFGRLPAFEAENELADLFEDQSCVNSPETSGETSFYTLESTYWSRVIKDKLSRMKPGGGTASYQGIIRAAQMALTGKNARRLIIVLSDGEDNDLELHAKMVNKGYCDQIRQTIGAQISADGHAVKAEIIVIGFSYRMDFKSGLCRCADQSYQASDVAELYRILRSVIWENIGHIHREPPR